MPIYEYHCAACDHDFEVIQKMSDAPIRKCESCGKNKAKRSVSRTSFILKGGGWYAEGYGSGKGGSSTASASSPSSSPSPSSTAKAANE